jgi:ABC-type nitrate/sulfonate/bicarbonate transport system permease component
MSANVAKIWGLRLLLVVVILGAWTYATGPGGVSPILLPRLDLVWQQLVALLQEGPTWAAIGVTLFEIGLAFVVSTVAGIGLGFVCSRTPLRAKVSEPLLAWGYLAPLVLFYPLFILWFGVGLWSKILYSAVSGFFPIAFNALRGFQAVDERYLKVAKAFGASPGQTDRLVKVWAALPMVMSGVRIGAALNIITVVLAEMLASERGLGYELAYASQTMQVARVFALIIVLLCIVALLQLLIQRFAKPRHDT